MAGHMVLTLLDPGLLRCVPLCLGLGGGGELWDLVLGSRVSDSGPQGSRGLSPVQRQRCLSPLFLPGALQYSAGMDFLWPKAATRLGLLHIWLEQSKSQIASWVGGGRGREKVKQCRLGYQQLVQWLLLVKEVYKNSFN